MSITVESISAIWSDPATRPKFAKGCLITKDGGCYCAQGDILHRAGWTDDQLRKIYQRTADKEVAALLGISVAHAVLLRRVNDSSDGQPQQALMAERVPEYGEALLGPMHAELFAFFRRLDAVTSDQWAAARDAGLWDVNGPERLSEMTLRAETRDATWAAARAAGRVDAVVLASAVGEAAYLYASGAVQDAAVALCLRDRLQLKHGFTRAHYDALTAPCRRAGIVIHPEDKPMY